MIEFWNNLKIIRVRIKKLVTKVKRKIVRKKQKMES